MKLLLIEREGILDRFAPKELKERCELVYVPTTASTDEILRFGRDADAVVIDAMSVLSGDAIRQMPRLKLIHSDGVGYQGIDLEAAAERGVFVCNCRGMNAHAVAEQTLLLMLGCLKDIVGGHRDVLNAQQLRRKERYMVEGNLRELGDCTVGFVGYGAIAQEAARLAAAFGAKTLYYKRSPIRGDTVAAYRDLDALLAESDLVSLHLPLSPATEKMVDDSFFDRMKPGAILINTARGDLVDTEALLRSLRSGKLAAAGLDCLSAEPVQPDHPLLLAEPELQKRLLLSPHIGGVTASSFRRGYAMIWEDLKAVLEGKTPARQVSAR